MRSMPGMFIVNGSISAVAMYQIVSNSSWSKDCWILGLQLERQQHILVIESI